MEVLSSHGHGSRTHDDAHVDVVIHALTAHVPSAPYGFPRGAENMSLFPWYENHVDAHMWEGEIKQIFTYAFKHLFYDNYINWIMRLMYWFL